MTALSLECSAEEPLKSVDSEKQQKKERNWLEELITNGKLKAMALGRTSLGAKSWLLCSRLHSMNQ